MLYRLGKWSFLNKWKVIVAWVLLFVGGALGAVTLSKPLTSDFAISGTPSIDALVTLTEQFPDQSDPVQAPTVNLVFAAPQGDSLANHTDAIDATVGYIKDNLSGIKGDQRFGNPVEINKAQTEQIVSMMTEMGLPKERAEADAHNVRLVSDDGRIGYTTFEFGAETSMQVTDEERAVVDRALEIGRERGLQVEAGGPGFGEPIQIKSTSEIVGIAIAFLVMMVTFGSLIAAGMPVITAVVGVGLGAFLTLIVTNWVDLNEVTPVMAIMIGLAVGIDYALFILSRYRQERRHLPGPEAAGLATGTAGSSVVFAGSTVFTALVALVLARIEFLSWMGLSAALTVAIAVAVAITLLPALMGLFGDKMFGVRLPFVAKHDENGRTMGRAWVNFVAKAPALVMAVVVLALGGLALPALNMELSLPSDSNSDTDTTQRKSADLMAEGFGPGVNAPFLLVVDAHDAKPDSEGLKPYINLIPDEQAPGPQKKAALATFMYAMERAGTSAGITHAQLVGVNEDMTAAQILATPKTGPDDEYTVDTAHALREIDREIEDVTGAKVGLTGFTAVQMDITEALSGAMPLYLAIVVGLAIVLLILVFRSLLVPLVAGLGFLLSMAASFGVTVAVFQNGFGGLVNTPGPILSFLPILLIGVTFGLAMDYQVFLVTRMREEYTRLRSADSDDSDGSDSDARLHAVERSTIEGFTRGARVVTAAAIIMIAVFVAFIDQPLPFIKIFGFSLGAAVLFDAFFVRMALVPATMFILGNATWWMPKWLDKALPNLDIEGEALEKEFAHA
ncbi:Membrane protein YdfJ [Corynebacterium aquatimens]|nr:MMPL family transporter [Corynebacterium aquatimens]WJY64886.1 Membrane protein YdfJ [Corynebacterium aquatimens]